jgi:uncharacterized protein YjbI with pentapeptide repeats
MSRRKSNKQRIIEENDYVQSIQSKIIDGVLANETLFNQDLSLLKGVAIFENCKMARCRNAPEQNVEFKNCTIENWYFTQGWSQGENKFEFNDCTLTYSSFTFFNGLHIVSNKETTFKYIRFFNSKLFLDLSHSNMDDCEFEKCQSKNNNPVLLSLLKTDLNKTKFKECYLNNSKFNDSYLENVTFTNSHLKNVKFKETYFSDNVIFINCDLSSSVFIDNETNYDHEFYLGDEGYFETDTSIFKQKDFINCYFGSIESNNRAKIKIYLKNTNRNEYVWGEFKGYIQLNGNVYSDNSNQDDDDEEDDDEDDIERLIVRGIVEAPNKEEEEHVLKRKKIREEMEKDNNEERKKQKREEEIQKTKAAMKEEEAEPYQSCICGFFLNNDEGPGTNEFCTENCNDVVQNCSNCKSALHRACLLRFCEAENRTTIKQSTRYGHTYQWNEVIAFKCPYCQGNMKLNDCNAIKNPDLLPKLSDEECLALKKQNGGKRRKRRFKRRKTQKTCRTKRKRTKRRRRY